MDNTTIHIGGFSYALGENEYALEELEEIKDNPVQINRLKRAGFEKYRTSNQSVLDLAGEAVNELFRKISITPSEIDVVIFSTSSFGINAHLSHADLCRFLVKHGLTKAYPMTSSLSFCGNFLPALRTAYNYLKTTEFSNILVVLSDIIPTNSSYLTPPDVAVGSDGASCCLLSKTNFAGLELQAISQVVNVEAGLMDPGKDFLLYSKAVGDGIKEAIRKTFQQYPESKSRLTQVFTNNYSKSVCQSFLRLVQLPETKLYAENISRFGHAGAADICINLADYLNYRSSEQHEELLILSSGPFMWGSALIKSVQQSI